MYAPLIRRFTLLPTVAEHSAIKLRSAVNAQLTFKVEAEENSIS